MKIDILYVHLRTDISDVKLRRKNTQNKNITLKLVKKSSVDYVFFLKINDPGNRSTLSITVEVYHASIYLAS